MPGLLDESAAIFRWLADEVSPHTFINVMDQYQPANKVGPTCYGELNRRTSATEMDDAYRLAREAGLQRFD
jgi:putative pyruvate formate lyase activating enzyme